MDTIVINIHKSIPVEVEDIVGVVVIEVPVHGFFAAEGVVQPHDALQVVETGDVLE